MKNVLVRKTDFTGSLLHVLDGVWFSWTFLVLVRLESSQIFAAKSAPPNVLRFAPTDFSDSLMFSRPGRPHPYSLFDFDRLPN